jgi:hypothetical protein
LELERVAERDKLGLCGSERSLGIRPRRALFF